MKLGRTHRASTKKGTVMTVAEKRVHDLAQKHPHLSEAVRHGRLPESNPEFEAVAALYPLK